MNCGAPPGVRGREVHLINSHFRRSKGVLQISKRQGERIRFDQQRARAIDDIQGEACGRRERPRIETGQRRSKYAARLRRGAAADREIRAAVRGIGKAAHPVAVAARECRDRADRGHLLAGRADVRAEPGEVQSIGAAEGCSRERRALLLKA